MTAVTPKSMRTLVCIKLPFFWDVNAAVDELFSKSMLLSVVFLVERDFDLARDEAVTFLAAN